MNTPQNESQWAQKGYHASAELGRGRIDTVTNNLVIFYSQYCVPAF